MRSRDMLRRLDRLGVQEPVPEDDFAAELDEVLRFTTDIEAAEMGEILAFAAAEEWKEPADWDPALAERMFELYRVAEARREADPTWCRPRYRPRGSDREAWATAAALSRFTARCPDLPQVPLLGPGALNAFRLEQARQLLSRYGWEAEGRSVDTVASIGDWEPEDRQALAVLLSLAGGTPSASCDA